MSIYWNGSEINSLMCNCVETTGVYNGEVIWGNSSPSFKSITLYHSEGGTLTANELTGYPGDTINLSTAYNTYWRFSGYQLTGDGTLANNTYTFGNEDATICACYKKNAFTAKGNFDKGSNNIYNPAYKSTSTGINDQYGILTAYTGDIPSNWHSTSNRWNPSNASSYSISYTGNLSYWRTNTTASNRAGVTAKMYVGGTEFDQQAWGNGTTPNTGSLIRYSKTRTVTNQGYIRCYGTPSARRLVYGIAVAMNYLASGTDGTWLATGYIP